MKQDLDSSWLESGWWDDTLAVNLVADDAAEGLSLLVAVGAGLATSPPGFTPSGLYLPRPPVNEFWLVTPQVELAQRMANAWRRQHPCSTRREPVDESSADPFAGLVGGMSSFDPTSLHYVLSGDHGHRLVIAGSDGGAPNNVVLLGLRSEGLVGPWESTTWRLSKNLLRFFTLANVESGAFVQCASRLVDDGTGAKVLCVGVSHQKVLNHLKPYLARRAFYGEMLGEMAAHTFSNIRFEKSYPLKHLIESYRSGVIRQMEADRRPGQWRRRKVFWPCTDMSGYLRQNNPQTLGKIKHQLPTAKHIVDTLRDGKLFGHWLDHSGGWKVLVERPKMREACIVRIRPPRKAT